MSLKIDVMKEKVYGHSDVITDPAHWEIGHHFADKLYAKEIHLPAGSEVIQHNHDYDHLSIYMGELILTVGDEERHLIGPGCITVEKGKNHGIKALTDVTWYCIHNEETALWPS